MYVITQAQAVFRIFPPRNDKTSRPKNEKLRSLGHADICGLPRCDMSMPVIARRGPWVAGPGASGPIWIPIVPYLDSQVL